MAFELAWPAVAESIVAATGTPFPVERRAPIGGGCIHAAYRIEGAGQRYFVKLNDRAQLPLFEAEAAGLGELASARAIRIPQVIAWGADDTSSWLVLEFIELGRGAPASMARLGAQLAELHRVTATGFGWHQDNAIGLTPQINTPTDDWGEFFRDRRLRFQLELAAQNGGGGALQSQGARLLDNIGALFRGYAPRPSLLHGDLWSGNVGFDENGAPVLIDPAVYHGDRETDLAMTQLFGGFSADFYAAYQEAFPLDAGASLRRDIYNLYHVLNHLNLFGGDYHGQALEIIERLLARI